MDTSRISQGELIAGIGGLALFISLFLNWFAGSAGGRRSTSSTSCSRSSGSAWRSWSPCARRVTRSRCRAARPIALAGFAATCIVLTFLLEAEERDFGIFLALAAAIAIVYGGWTAAGARR